MQALHTPRKYRACTNYHTASPDVRNAVYIILERLSSAGSGLNNASWIREETRTKRLQELFGFPDLDVPPKKTLQRLRGWSLHGSKLDLMWNEFDPDYLFCVGHLLSADLLKNKFTASGTPKNQAFEYLHSLGLKETSEGNAGELARNIRLSFIGPFEDQMTDDGMEGGRPIL
ncbi:MAG: hypothetical protein L6R42_007107 [Xanthoria sp. 1 TBL-2021]|nr:MAG: hypothetical protein L6R42_007107 [Xanthoria sp. 1 TBL-2021]